MQNIYYAVLAVRNSTLDTVLATLDDRGDANVAAWLRARAATLYGPTSDGWKPFGTRSVQQLMGATPRSPNVAYSSQSTLVEVIDPVNPEHLNNLAESAIQVFLIDALATYLPTHATLARRIDIFVSQQTHCCVLCPPDAPPEVTAHARECWPLLRDSYKGGRPHRFVQEPDDLENFKYLTLRILNNPDVPDAAVKVRLGHGQMNSRDQINAALR